MKWGMDSELNVAKGKLNYILLLFKATPTSSIIIVLAQILATCGSRERAGKPPEPGLGQGSGTFP